MFLFIVYQLLWLVACVVGIPYWFFLLVRGNVSLLEERCGRYNVPGGSYYWVHAASVGEVKIALRFIEAFRAHSMQSVLLTVMTPTGYAYAQKRVTTIQNLYVGYAPCDWIPFVLGMLHRLHITQCAIVETEIWPAYITACKLERVPVAVINGRISEKAFQRYTTWKKLFTPVFAKLSCVCAQSPDDKKHFIALGCDPAFVHVVENIKYDLLPIATTPDMFTTKREEWKHRLVFVAGSVRTGEEDILIRTFQTLKPAFPNLLLVIAPRHLDNVPRIIARIEAEHLHVVTYSYEEFPMHTDVMVVDEMGVLVELYKQADLVFVGGSLVNKGGQNIIEPASFGKPVLFGKYMDNFRDVAKKFCEAHAAVRVDSEEDFKKQTAYLLSSEDARLRIAHNALAFLRGKQGGAERTAEKLIQ